MKDDEPFAPVPPRTKHRNLFTAIIIAVFIVMVILITVLKIGPAVFERNF